MRRHTRNVLSVLFSLALLHGTTPPALRSQSPLVIQSWGPRDGLPHATILALAQTSDGFLWLATPAGLARFDGRRFEFIPPPTDLPAFNPRSLAADHHGWLWSVSDAGALARIRPGRWLPLTHDHHAPTNAHGVYRDGTGGIVVSTTSGHVHRWRTLRVEPWLPPVPNPGLPFVGINTDFHGNVWVRHGHRLWTWSDHEWSELSSPTGGTDITALKTTGRHAGGMWISTPTGVSPTQLHHLGPERFHYPEPVSSIQTMLEEPTGHFFVSTGQQGLLHFKPDGSAERLDVDQGLPSSAVLALTLDAHGDVWAGTDQGLCRIQLPHTSPPEAPEIHPAVRSLSADGAAITETPPSPSSPPSDSRRVWTLPSPPRVVTIHCEAANLAQPGQVRFRHRLLGLDDVWSEASTSGTVSFTNLPPGRFELHLATDLGTDQWSDPVEAALLHVPAAFWQTWWFRTALLVATGTGMLAFLTLRTRAAERQRHEQQQLSRRLIESQELERQRIAAELHDSLGQQLLVIRNLAQLGLAPPPATPSPITQLEKVADASTVCLDEVRRLARNLRPYQLDQMGLTMAIRSLATQISQSSSLQLTASLDPLDHRLPAPDEIHLFRIVQEGLNNILKHSGATEASLVIECTGRDLSLTLHDNGRGFTPSSAEAGFGLSSVRERAAILRGHLDVRSNPGSGTAWHLQIPLPPPATTP